MLHRAYIDLSWLEKQNANPNTGQAGNQRVIATLSEQIRTMRANIYWLEERLGDYQYTEAEKNRSSSMELRVPWGNGFLMDAEFL